MSGTVSSIFAGLVLRLSWHESAPLSRYSAHALNAFRFVTCAASCLPSPTALRLADVTSHANIVSWCSWCSWRRHDDDVQSHRSMSRIKSVTSPPVIGLCILFSMGVAAVAVPFWETVVVLASGFWTTSSDQVPRA